MLRLVIDGEPREVREGSTVLDAIRGAGRSVPTLCHDPRVRPTGACRLCVVALEGSDRLLASCTTPAAAGMRISTRTPQVEEHRRTILRLLAERYPADPPPAGDTEFHGYLREYGVAPAGARRPDAFQDHQHPYLRVEMDRCVHCFRCVRICDELQGQFAWRVWDRADGTRIVPDSGGPLTGSSCVSCGACADSCPSGAIVDRAVAERGVPTAWTRTTCPYCGTGCEMEVGVREGEVVVARPVLDAPVSKGHLCVKGRYAHRYAHAKDRVLSPMIRVDGEWRRVSWDEALEFTASGFRKALAEGGPEAVGVLGSSRATNEENYVAQKFARVVLGSNNVDCCARVCHAPSAAALKATLGTGAATNSFDDIELARGFLICGANPTENHPIVGARIKQAVLKGASLVVIDPRRIELAQYADVHLAIRPGTNVPVLHGIAHALIGEELIDHGFVRDRTADFEALVSAVLEWTPERAGEVAGVDPQDIRRAARVYAAAKPAMVFHGLGMTEHTQGTEGVRCLVNLVLLTGNIGKPGSGENPLRGQNNVQGSAHMGCEPSHLAGYTPIEAAAPMFESVWGVPVPRHKGLNWMAMLDSARDRKLRALWAIGYDVYFSNPNASATAEGLGGLDLLVVQDLFLNETAREFAHVFLPACSPYEKDGTFMNSERRVQRVRRCIPTLGDSKSDWRIVCDLAARMGFGEQFAFDSPESIWEEVRKVWKAGAGISYERIEQHGLQWPCLDDAHAGTKRLHAQTFPHGDRASFSPIEYVPSPETTNEEFPFMLNTGRTLYQFNAGTMTQRTPNAELRPTDLLDIAPADAERLGIGAGEAVRITSRYGAATLPARLDPGVREGELFTTFHDPRVFTNRVTSPHRDRVVGAPEYKLTAVRVERADSDSS